MKFERLRLENFKCYEDEDVRLDRGVTVIHGLNGSGKSTLLEACFFALYGSKALDSRLDEVVTIGADEATVELWFTHGGAKYRIERRVRVRDDRAQTTACVLDTTDGTIEGAKDVRAHVSTLLRMDAEAFVNCAYVRQGEVNKLINASPRQRQDVIDDLLQLGRLETYRERASDARVGVGRVRDGKRGELEGVVDQIEAKEAEDLHARLNDLQTERVAVTEELDRIESRREQAIQTRDHEATVVEEADEQRETIDELEEAIDDIRSNIEETERAREEKREQIRELRENAETKREELSVTREETDIDVTDQDSVDEAIEALETRDEELLERLQEQQLNVQEQSNRVTQCENDAEEYERRAKEAREEASEIESKLETSEETLAERRERIEALTAEREAKREQFDDAPCDVGNANEYRQAVSSEVTTLREREAERRSDLKSAREALEEAERLKAEGKCPECGQSIAGSPHVEAIDERRVRVSTLEAALEEAESERVAAEARLERAETLVELDSEIEQLEAERKQEKQLIEREEDDITSKRERIEDRRERADELSSAADDAREAAAQARERAAECRSVVADINADRQDLEERIERLESVRSLLDEIDAADSEIERLRNRRKELAELNEERRDHLAEKREQKQELAEQFDEERVEEAKENKAGAERFIEWADDKLDELEDRRDTLQGRIGGVKNDIEMLETLRERRETLAATVERLETLYEETEQLQTMYADLRAELRQRNVRTLEQLLNETFGLVYQNDSYARIELDGEYGLTVYQKDDQALEPEQLSGGERALFNLSLRCAIYRLLAEGIEGGAPMPPLILDEPTVFLDAGHVSKLLDLVESMRDIGVEQIVVVSHDEELVGAADNLVQVAKNPTTNRSTVERREAVLSAD